MENDELRSIAELLDAKIPREGARVKLHQHGGGPDESEIVANSAGYGRLAVEFLKAAVVVTDVKAPSRISVDLDYLITDDSDVGFDSFERSEGPFVKSSRVAIKQRLIGIAFAVLILGTIALALIGLVVVVRFVF